MTEASASTRFHSRANSAARASSPSSSSSSSSSSSAAGHAAPEPPEELCCPVTYELFTDPVVAADGRTYEKKAMARVIKEHEDGGGTLDCAEIAHALRTKLEARKIADNFDKFKNPPVVKQIG